MKEPGAIQFERTVYIPHPEPECEANQHLPTERVQLAYPCILSVDAVAKHCIIFLDEREKALQVTNVKLSIGVHKKGEFLCNNFKATHQSRSIALIHFVIDNTYMCIYNSNLFNDFARSILTAIVHYNYLEILCPLRNCIYG